MNTSGPYGPLGDGVLPVQMISVSNAPPPANALAGGVEPDGSLVFPCVASYQGGMHPGKTVRGWASCDIGWGGGEHWIPSYYVLVPQFNAAPLNSATHPFIAGNDSNGTPLGICHAAYGSGVQLGKYLSSGACSFGYGGREVALTSGFQVLSKYQPVIR